jgi:cell division protein FtsL
VTLGFYFWGKVRVDLKINENYQLELEKRRLQTDVNDLRAQVQELMSYHRIVDLAKKRGLVILSAANQANLPIKLEGLNPKYDSNIISRIHYAGLTPVPAKNNHRE